MIFFGSFALIFSINPPAPIPAACAQGALPTVLCLVPVASFTRSSQTLQERGLRMQRPHSPGHLVLRLWWAGRLQAGAQGSPALAAASSPICLRHLPFLSKNYLYLSAHIPDCRLSQLKERKENTHYKCPLDGLSSHSQLPLILGRGFPTETNAIIILASDSTRSLVQPPLCF